MTIDTLLKQQFGFNSFRPFQKEISEAILSKQDVIAILPTGSGKSLAYQLPAVASEGTSIVISPLIALMEDQVRQLEKLGIAAAFVNSSRSAQENNDTLRRMQDFHLLYLSPERLMVDGFLDHLKMQNISSFIIDEAHCISQWGHDFRTEYRKLGCLKEIFPQIPIATFTATATQQVASDIQSQLHLKNPFIAIAGFDRPNLMLRAYQRTDGRQQLLDVLSRYPDASGIVYCATRKNTEKFCDFLDQKGYRVAKYHAGMPDRERQNAHRQFINDDVDIIVATQAFGMGINKPDVRFVIHMDMPKTMEQYYQEIGRAGRDGLPSEVVMFYSIRDAILQKHFSEQLSDPQIKQSQFRKTDQMFAFSDSVHCRRLELLRYFGDTAETAQCGHCDNCLDPVDWIDGTIIAQKILSCVYRVDQRFGISHIIDVLYGADTANIKRLGHKDLSTYNLLSDTPKSQIRTYIYALMNQGYVQLTEGQYPVLQLTESARKILFEGESIRFKQRELKKKNQKKQSIKTFSKNPDLFELLRDHRKSLADEHKIPPYLIFHDKTLIELSDSQPKTDSDFLDINGVGPAKLKAYGASFMKVIHNFQDQKVAAV